MLYHTCVCLCVYYYRRLLYVFYNIMLDIGERAFELMFLVVIAIPMKIKIIYLSIYQCGEDNACRCRCASTPPYMDWIYWPTETFTIFALSTY